MSNRTFDNGRGARDLLVAEETAGAILPRLDRLEQSTGYRGQGGVTGGGDPNLVALIPIPLVADAQPVTTWSGDHWIKRIEVDVAYDFDLVYDWQAFAIEITGSGGYYNRQVTNDPLTTWAIEDAGFEFGNTYAVRLQARTARQGWGDYCDYFPGIYFAPDPTHPDGPAWAPDPAPMAGLDETGAWAVFDWLGVPQLVQGYLLAWREDGTDAWTTNRVDNGDTFGRARGLLSGVDYEVRVGAIPVDGGLETYGSIITYTAYLPDPAPPSALHLEESGVSGFDTDGDGLPHGQSWYMSFEWTEPSAVPKNLHNAHRLQYRGSHEVQWQEVVVYPDAAALRVDNVLPNVYEVRINSEYYGLGGLWSDPLTVAVGIPTPAAPTLTGYALGQDRGGLYADVAFTEPSATPENIHDAHELRVQFDTGPVPLSRIIFKEGPTAWRVHGLTEGEHYTAEIRSLVTIAGVSYPGPWSAPLSITTSLGPPSPTSLSISGGTVAKDGLGQATVEWVPPAGEPLPEWWELLYTPDGVGVDGLGTEGILLQPNITKWIVSKLRVGQLYNYTMRAWRYGVPGAYLSPTVPYTVGVGALDEMPTFEIYDPLLADPHILGWSREGGSGTTSAERNTAQVLKGTASLRQTFLAGSSAIAHWNDPVAVKENTVYTWNTALATIAAPAGQQASIQFFWLNNANGTISAPTTVFTPPVAAWRSEAGQVTSPAGAVKVRVRLASAGGSGSVYWSPVGWKLGVGGPDLLPGSVDTTILANDAVTAPKIAALAVIAGKIAAGAVGTSEIVAAAITSGLLAPNSVIAGKIAAGGVSASNQFGAGVVDSPALGAASVVAGKLAAGAIDASNLFTSGVVNNAALGALSVTTAKLALLSVDSGVLAANSVIAGKINAAAINAANLFASGVVDAAAIGTGAVTSIKLGLLAVKPSTADLGQPDLVSNAAQEITNTAGTTPDDWIYRTANVSRQTSGAASGSVWTRLGGAVALCELAGPEFVHLGGVAADDLLIAFDYQLDAYQTGSIPPPVDLECYSSARVLLGTVAMTSVAPIILSSGVWSRAIYFLAAASFPATTVYCRVRWRYTPPNGVSYFGVDTLFVQPPSLDCYRRFYRVMNSSGGEAGSLGWNSTNPNNVLLQAVGQLLLTGAPLRLASSSQVQLASNLVGAAGSETISGISQVTVTTQLNSPRLLAQPVASVTEFITALMPAAYVQNLIRLNVNSVDVFVVDYQGNTTSAATVTSKRVVVTPTATNTVPIQVNAPSGQSASLLDLLVNGVSKFKVQAGGIIEAAADLLIGGAVDAVSGTFAGTMTSRRAQVTPTATNTILIQANAPSGQSTHLLDLLVNNVTKFRVSNAGDLTIVGALSAASSTLSGALSAVSGAFSGALNAASLTLTGDLVVGSGTNSGKVRNLGAGGNSELILGIVDDQYGDAGIVVHNRGGENGPILYTGKKSDGSFVQLLDIGLRWAIDGSGGTSQTNLRVEDRNAYTYMGTNPELQWGTPGAPFLCVSTAGLYVRTGLLRLGSQLRLSGSAPGISTGTGAGTAPTGVSVTGNDTSGKIVLTTGGTAPAANAQICRITFTTSRPTANTRVIVCQANVNSSTHVARWFSDDAVNAAGFFDLKSTATALANTTAYIWYYWVVSVD